MLLKHLVVWGGWHTHNKSQTNEKKKSPTLNTFVLSCKVWAGRGTPGLPVDVGAQGGPQLWLCTQSWVSSLPWAAAPWAGWKVKPGLNPAWSPEDRTWGGLWAQSLAAQHCVPLGKERWGQVFSWSKTPQRLPLFSRGFELGSQFRCVNAAPKQLCTRKAEKAFFSDHANHAFQIFP